MSSSLSLSGLLENPGQLDNNNKLLEQLEEQLKKNQNQRNGERIFLNLDMHAQTTTCASVVLSMHRIRTYTHINKSEPGNSANLTPANLTRPDTTRRTTHQPTL
ncbi:hypothetical protein T12_13441 [Trichinella patagoniensis]|uniref:Uncharacterized protein n=1 Tax=Trichinella patagoniensis TaxID=990121 RepID=A0A0V1A8I9_9BILA|nr:hypothetical protein T12_13441 [Trichinella patagoniensis]